MKVKQNKIIIFVSLYYIINFIYAYINAYIDPLLEQTYSFKLFYTKYAILFTFYIAIGFLLCGIYSCEKKHAFWEMIIVDIPAMIMIFSMLLYWLLPTNWTLFIYNQAGQLIPQGALLASVEILRFLKQNRTKDN